jgi:hypothetical protein
MKIILPKASKGLKFDLVFTVEMNDFDVEMLLPSLFHLVRTKGRRVGKPADPNLYQEYLSRLAQSDTVQGFSGHHNRALLDRWVRTSVVKMGGRGRSHAGEQITYLFPTTMLTYKAGLPKDITRLRGVHNFVYAVLLSHSNDPVKLDRLFRDALGRGLQLDDAEPFNGRYDGKSDIDIETMLSIRFLDQLNPAGVGPVSPEGNVTRNAPRLRQQSEYFAADILNTLRAYKAELPTTVLIRYLLALINCHLFVYSMRLMSWVIGIASGKGGPDPLHEFFVDCTGQRGSYCDELARSCLERDLEMLERYGRSSLRLRTVDRFLSLSGQLRTGLPERESDSGSYLRAITRLSSELQIEARADQEFEQICVENGLNASGESGGVEETEEMNYIRQLRDSGTVAPLDRLIQVLFEAQRRSAMQHLTRWFNSVAGVNRSYGLATGNTRGRWRVARYSLSNELLSTWVHAALAAFGTESNGEVLASSRVPLRQFLKWLEDRYGVLINRPPDFDTSAEAVAAAHQNLEAFKVRLRQIGVFQNLSDDFEAQYIQRPVCNPLGVNA